MDIIVVILSFINLLLLAKHIVFSVWKKEPLIALFSLLSLYFISIPLFLDSFSVLFGYREFWEALITDNDLNYRYHLDSIVLLRVSLFILLFNSLFFLSYNYFRKMLTSMRPSKNNSFIGEVVTRHQAIHYIFFFSIFAWAGLFIFLWQVGFSTFISISQTNAVVMESISMPGPMRAIISLFFAMSGTAVYYAVSHNIYVGFVISLVPPLLISYITSHRPFVIPIIFCTLLAVLQRVYSAPFKRNYLSSGNFLKTLTKFIFIIFIAFILSLQFVFIRQGTVGVIDSIRHPYPISRDSSVNMAYYCFDEQGGYYDIGTNFHSIKRLLATGIPSYISGGFDDAYIDYDVTRYLAVKRFAWVYGTLHPSIYGWAFTDMKWYGCMLGIFVGLIVALVTHFSLRSNIVFVSIFSITSLFIAVAMRGSVQYAYSNFIYSLLIFGFVVYFLERTTKIFKNTISVTKNCETDQ